MAILFSDILRGWTMLGAIFAHRRPALVAIRVAAVLGIGVGLAASRATATCGDWLAHPNEGMAEKAMTQADADLDHDLNATTPSSTPHRPCRGPFCGQAPSAPAAPAPAPVPTVSDHTFALLALAALDGDEGGNFSWFVTDDGGPLSGFGRSIDHPPQA